MKKIANIKASDYVSEKVEFNGSNTFGRWIVEECYVVFSYGFHFPMYIFNGGQWYENADKYSVSTSKQQTQLRPRHINYMTGKVENHDFIKLSTNEMKTLANGGLNALLKLHKSAK